MGRLMEIVSSKKTKIFIGEIFEKYYEQILGELRKTELDSEITDIVMQETIANIYYKIKADSIDSEELLEKIASRKTYIKKADTEAVKDSETTPLYMGGGD